LATIDGGFFNIRKAVKEDELIYPKMWDAFVMLSMVNTGTGTGADELNKLLGM
jgi:hypothetical protein